MRVCVCVCQVSVCVLMYIYLCVKNNFSKILITCTTDPMLVTTEERREEVKRMKEEFLVGKRYLSKNVHTYR